MKRFFFAFYLLLLAAPSVTAQSASQIRIVPRPVSVEVHKGHFEVTPSTPVLFSVEQNNDQMLKSTRAFAGELKKLLGYQPGIVNVDGPSEVKSGGNEPVGIFLHISSAFSPEEYELKVTSNRSVIINGGDNAAVYHGLQTLKQLFISDPTWSNDGYVYRIPRVTIKDKPAFGYRGAMLDVSRHFSDIEEIKKFIDMLSMHKLNVFHFHITDDQGWRIQINSHPELTARGSVRTGTLIGHGGRPPFEYDDKPYAGCYTQDEIREIVRYAADRHITVIPEIEMPGHAMAALNAYPELGCTGGPYEVWRRWGVSDEVFCAGNDEVFAMLEDVLLEVLDLFPSELIHIGGDECPKTRWKECPKCQARIKEHGLKDEHELQCYFIQRIEKFMIAHGRNIIGWDEILEGGLSKTAAVMSWRGPEKGGIEAAKAGNNVVMVPTSHAYLDYYQDRDQSKEPFGIGGYVPLEKVYQLDPLAGIDSQYHKYIIGVQGNLWREYMKTMKHTEYMALPRLAAIAEVGWSYDRKDFEDFVDRLTTMRLMYEIYDYNYAPHIFEGGGRIVEAR